MVVSAIHLSPKDDVQKFIILNVQSVVCYFSSMFDPFSSVSPKL